MKPWANLAFAAAFLSAVFYAELFGSVNFRERQVGVTPEGPGHKQAPTPYKTPVGKNPARSRPFCIHGFQAAKLWPVSARRDAASLPLHAISHTAKGALRVGNADAYGSDERGMP